MNDLCTVCIIQMRKMWGEGQEVPIWVLLTNLII